MAFVYEEIDEAYIDFYNSCQFIGPFADEPNTYFEGKSWVIDKENDVALVFVAPRVIETPEFFDFVFFDKPEERIRILAFKQIISCRELSHQYDKIIDFDAILIPTGLVRHRGLSDKDMVELIKKAMIVYSKGMGKPRNITFNVIPEPEIVEYGTKWGSRKR